MSEPIDLTPYIDYMQPVYFDAEPASRLARFHHLWHWFGWHKHCPYTFTWPTSFSSTITAEFSPELFRLFFGEDQ